MLAKVKIIAHWILGVAAIVWLSAYTNSKVDDFICKHIEVQFVGKPDGQYLLSAKDVLNTIYDNDFIIVGKHIEQLDYDSIETCLEKLAHVKNATVYSDYKGQLVVKILEPQPLLRFLPTNGYSSFMMDVSGEIIPISKNYSPSIPVITGSLGDLAKSDLKPKRQQFKEEIYAYGLFLEANPFWSAQIQQTNVDEKSDLQLVPRVGYHNIELGKIRSFKKKLSKLKIFYTEGLRYTGWNKYSVIDLRYEGQIVCTKR
jgi:cell division protein FtsQ